MTILVINASLHEARSATRAMVAAYLEGVADQNPQVVEHDLAAEPIPHLSPAQTAAIRGEEGAEPGALGPSDRLIRELETAETLVLGVPMYNFAVPSTLKAWIDNVVRARRTFVYEDGQPRGLLDPSKQVLVFASCDGVYTSGPAAAMDFVEPYLRTILGFIGLTDVTFVWAEGQAIPDLRGRDLTQGLQTARDLSDRDAAAGQAS